MPEPHLRASDADRAAVAEVLGAHMSAGRLTVAEYDERLAAAYAARTYGELEPLTADLPRTPSPARQPSGATSAPFPRGLTPGHHWSQLARHGAPACGGWAGGAGLRAAWTSWAVTAAIVLTVWLATSIASGWVYFWPMWVIGPWGAVLLLQSATGRRGSDRAAEAEDTRPGRLTAPH